MKHVLDTNTVSLLMRGDEHATKKLTQLSRDETLLPQPVVSEIEYGLARLPKSARKKRLRERFDLMLAEIPRAAWTDDVSAAFGVIKADLERRGVRLEDFDVAIAAHATAAGATLVTANVKQMQRVRGLSIESWSRIKSASDER